MEEQTQTNETIETKPISLVEEAKAIRDEILKAKDELKEQNDRKEKIQANDLLGGTVGGSMPPTEQLTVEQQKQKNAQELFKGTALGDAIKKSNE